MADVSLESPVSGSEQVLFQQASGLASRGLNIQALTRQNGDMPVIRRRIASNAEEWCYSARPQQPFRFLHAAFSNSIRQFDSITEKTDIHAAVCHHPFTYFSLLSTGRVNRIPKIHVFHSPTHIEYFLLNENKSRLKNFLPVKARYLIEKFCHRRSTRVMVLSEYMKRRVQQLYFIPEDKIVVNPGGVDLTQFYPAADRQKLKIKLGFPDAAVHLLTIRNLEPRMGVDNLIRAAGLLKERGVDFHLTIGGEGPEKSRIAGLIDEHGLTDTITMAGFIPSAHLQEYYSAADFFIMPTRRLEGFGLVTVESMACETPVLGTPVGGTREILTRIDSRLLFRGKEPGDMARGIENAVHEIYANPDSYNELRTKCRRHARSNYTWQRHLNQLESVLVEEIQNNAHRSN